MCFKQADRKRNLFELHNPNDYYEIETKIK